MSELMQVFKRVLSHSTVELGQMHLAFERVDEKALADTGRFLAAVDASSTWWRGDFLNAYRDHVFARERKAGASSEAAAERANEAIREMLKADTEDPEKWLLAMRLAGFYPRATRRRLSARHHVEAMVGSEGDQRAAQQWLDLALEEGMTVPDLRQKIRAERGRFANDGRSPTGNGYSAVFGFARFVKQERRRTYTKEQARAVLDDLRPLVIEAEAWVAELERFTQS